MQRKLDNKDEQINQLTLEVRELKLNFQQQVNSNKHLTRQHDQLREEFTALEKKYRESERKASVLEMKVTDNDRTNNTLTTKISELKEDSKRQLSLIQELEERREKERSDYENDRRALIEQKKKVSKMIAQERQEMEAKFYSARHELIRDHKKDTEANKARWELKFQELLSQKRLEIKDAQSKLSSGTERLEIENRRLQREVNQKRTKNRELRNQIRDLNVELRRSQLDNAIPGATQIETLKEDSFTNEEKIEIQQMERQLNRLRNKLIGSADEIVILRKVNEVQKKKINDLVSQSEDNEKEKDRAHVEHVASQRKLKKQIDNLEARIEQMNITNTRDRREIARKIKESVQEKDEEIKELESRVTVLQEELKSARSRAIEVTEDFKTKFQEEKSYWEKVDRERTELVRELRRSNVSNDSLSQQLQDVSKQSVSYKSMLDTTNNKVQRLTAKVESLEGTVRKLRAI
eukprot:TRINITY_DN5287_c0_g1_i1.p1 TRINITY_DN5287_c0_g1~~TRINITY_DN5287_c0_g1_i1.p1  ORF type:complete len:486 (-),score=108.54 TRINITY_DN5287_c0_g1_i1:42-1436(-)